MTRVPSALAFALILSIGCTGSAPTDPQPLPASTAPEVAIRELKLPAPLDDRDVEFSGMAWHGDALVLLPQYPARWHDGPPCLYWIGKQALLAHIDGEGEAPLDFTALPVDLGGVPDRVADYQGFEGIAFRGDAVWLTVECEDLGYVVRGWIEPDRSRLVLDAETLTPVPYPRAMKNMGFETVVAAGDGALTLFEANGAGLGRFGEREGTWLADTGELSPVGVEAIEFRITDATALDAERRFWVSNYFYASNTDLECPKDPLRTGPLETHDRYPWVERLVELELVQKGKQQHVQRSGRPPLWLQLADDKGRNWEGIVRLDDRGFLLVTDKYPRTIFAFVELPGE